ncbi:MAG: EXPERA domain-containing protein [Candidatus Thorarchaeota archaeon]
MIRESFPIKNRDKARKIMDIIILVFFIFNFIFICYLFDIEQLIVLDHSVVGTPGYIYPPWPPKFIVDLNHWVGQFDPALFERPVWWRATIWIDVVFFGPFYAVATYAFIRGKNWIRMPSIIWASVMLTNVTVILFTEFVGYPYNPYWYVVVSANLLWILFPIFIFIRMALYPNTFSGERINLKKEQQKLEE